MIKKIFTLSLMLFLAIHSAAQLPEAFDSRKFIEVTGSAEMSIVPDQISLEVVLCEFNKMDISKVEEKFYEILKQNNIAKEAITIESYYFNWWYCWSYKHDHLRTKTFTVKLDNKTNLMKLAKDLHEGWVQSTRVTSYSNKDVQKLRKDIKMEAMKAAKEKAGYMLESVGEKAGGILSVTEIPETPNYGYYSQYSNSNMFMKSSSEPGAGIENAGEIKLRYEVKVKFEIK